MIAAELAARIDLAYLLADQGMSVAGLRSAAELAESGGFRSLCVYPVHAATVKRHFPRLRVSAVVSYPLGLDTLGAKLSCCQELLDLGVDELDVVLDLFALVNSNRAKTELEARELLRVTRRAGAMLKCIVEAQILSDAQLRAAAETLSEVGVDCVKTSTGYHREPTTPRMVELLRQSVGERCLVKASGGIRSLADAQTLLDAGADILGTSSGAAILEEARRQRSR